MKTIFSLAVSSFVSTAIAYTTLDIQGVWSTEKIICSSNNQDMGWAPLFMTFSPGGVFLASVPFKNGCQGWEETTFSVSGTTLNLGASVFKNSCGEPFVHTSARPMSLVVNGNSMSFSVQTPTCDNGKGSHTYVLNKVSKY